MPTRSTQPSGSKTLRNYTARYIRSETGYTGQLGVT